MRHADEATSLLWFLGLEKSSRGSVLQRVIGLVVVRRWRNQNQKKRWRRNQKKQKSLQKKLAQALKRLLLDSRIATEHRNDREHNNNFTTGGDARCDGSVHINHAT